MSIWRPELLSQLKGTAITQLHHYSALAHYCHMGRQANLASFSNFSRVQKSGIFEWYFQIFFTFPVTSWSLVSKEAWVLLWIFSSCQLLGESKWYQMLHAPQAGRSLREKGKSGPCSWGYMSPLSRGVLLWRCLALQVPVQYGSFSHHLLFGAQKCRLGKRIVLVLYVFPVIISISIVLWGHGSWRRKSIYDSLKTWYDCQKYMKSVTGDVRFKSWFYLCSNGVNIANFSAGWKINTAFPERCSSCSSPPASLPAPGSLGLNLGREILN